MADFSAIRLSDQFLASQANETQQAGDEQPDRAGDWDVTDGVGQSAHVERWLTERLLEREVRSDQRQQRHVGGAKGSQDAVEQEAIGAGDVAVIGEAGAERRMAGIE